MAARALRWLAVGIVAGQLDTAPAEALARMRAHALSHDMLLTELATQILTTAHRA